MEYNKVAKCSIAQFLFQCLYKSSKLFKYSSRLEIIKRWSKNSTLFFKLYFAFN